MQTTATKRTNYDKRETSLTWTGQPDSITEEGSTWAGQVEITISHYKQTKQFVAYARYALTKNERGFNVTHYALYDQENYPSTRIAVKPAPRYSDKALDIFADEVLTGLNTLAEGNEILARLLATAEELTKS
jgi:hypothetical protein